ncbi:MAG: hypothetical protein CAK90_05945 [Spartobacteria bacterium AMD-G4]|nr:MAG: hypothetical protein CAK90_05945 [Spartobacteria bacterium AMD-G4]
MVAAALSRRGAGFAIVERIPLWRFEVCLSISQYMEGVAVLTRAQNLLLGTAPAHCLNQKRNQGRGLFTNDRNAR